MIKNMFKCLDTRHTSHIQPDIPVQVRLSSKENSRNVVVFKTHSTHDDLRTYARVSALLRKQRKNET